MSKKETAVVATEEKKPVLKPHIAELSEKIQGLVAVSKTDGTIGDPEGKSAFETLMPEGITPETDKLHSEYRADYVAASGHASGVLSVGLMAHNKKITTVTAELAMGKDVVRHSVDHDRTFTFGSGADRKETTKFGNMTTEVDIKGTHGGSGQLKIARGLVGELATEKLGGKK
jgi:hypothetical protein